MKTEQRPAHHGNFTLGRTQPIDRVVIHVAAGSFGGTLSWFQNPTADVSAHYTVGMDGRVGQSVQEEDTAWHAGLGTMNARSIGIEHEGRPSQGPWTPSDAQLNSSAQLVAEICRTYRIPADREHIIGHHEVIPTRRDRANCPGPTWPWESYIMLVRAYLSPSPILVEPEPLTGIEMVYLNGELLPGVVDRVTRVGRKLFVNVK